MEFRPQKSNIAFNTVGEKSITSGNVVFANGWSLDRIDAHLTRWWYQLSEYFYHYISDDEDITPPLFGVGSLLVYDFGCCACPGVAIHEDDSGDPGQELCILRRVADADTGLMRNASGDSGRRVQISPAFDIVDRLDIFTSNAMVSE